jgi:hypothetical protein
LQQQLVLNLDEHDPLSFLVSDGFFALADANKGNLVACPCDDLFYINFAKAEDKSFKLPKFLNDLQEDGMTITSDADWTVAAPFDRLDADKARSNRKLLGNCLREAAQQGCISIETAAKLALSEDAYRSADLTWVYGSFGEKYLPYMTRDKGLLRFYRSLSTSQIGDLEAGSNLTVGALSKDQWQLLQDFIYRSNRMDIVGLVDDEYENMGDYILEREVTELLPEGMPGDATISMKSSENDLLFAGINYENMPFAEEVTLGQIADYIAAKQAGPNVGDGTTVQWISSGHSRGLSFEFDFPPRLKSTGSLREVVQGAERLPLDKLPADLKKRLDAAVVAARAKLDKTPADQPVPVATPPSFLSYFFLQ